MLATALRNLLSFKRPQGVARPADGGDFPSPKSLTPELIKKLEEGDEDALRYPPYVRGYPAFIAGSVLLDFHKEKIGQIASGIGLPPSQFDKLIRPALVSYANFVHLVPASQNHHHRAWGGLLSHGLEVALLALNSCQTTSFDHGRVPQERTKRKERWYAAAVFASLLHDTGKPLSDFRITDSTGDLFWKPVSKSIPEWAKEHGLERYYLHWNPGRHERHKNLSTTMVDRILHPAVREWLMDGGQDLYSAMVAAITGDDEKSSLTGIVIKADSASVQLDLKKRGGDPAGTAAAGTGVPIASHVINAMRLLRQNGVWNANAHGERIWSTTQGIFIAWNAGAPEVVDKMVADGLKAFPRSADSLGEILADHDIFERHPNGSIYWQVAPDMLSQGKSKILRLKCIKLTSHSTLYPYDPAPPPVAVVIGDEKDAMHYDPANGAMGVPVGEGALEAQKKGIELAPVGSDGQAPDDSKPMFDLEGGNPSPAPAATPSGSNAPAFSAPSLAPTPAGGQAGKGGVSLGTPGPAKPSEAPKKPGLVIGAPPPANTASKSASAPEASAPKQRPALQLGGEAFSGVKIGVEMPSLEDEPAQATDQPSWDDPFASPDQQLDGDPFVAKAPAPKAAPAKEPASEPPAKPRQSEAGADQLKEPRAPHHEVNQPRSAPGLQIGAKAPEVKLEQPAADAETVGAKPGEQFETVNITGDFDAEILELTGIEQAFAEIPVKVERAPDEVSFDPPQPLKPQRPAATQVVPQRQDPEPAPAAHKQQAMAEFEEAFRFDAEHVVLDGFDVPDLPSDNPLGISAPEEFADLDVSSFTVQEAPRAVSLEGFDLPALDSTMFVGGAPVQPIIGQGDIGDLKAVETPDTEDTSDSDDHSIQEDDQAVEAGQGEKKKRRRKKKKSGSVTRMPVTDFGTPLITGAAPGITIGPARKDQSQSKPLLLEKSPASEPIARIPTPTVPVVAVESTDVAPAASEYLAYLNRHPELAAKFLWYVQNPQASVRVFKKHQTLFAFREGGFQPGDEAALNVAHWLWFDFTEPERLVFSANRETGVVLTPYLAEALSVLSDGKFELSLTRPASGLTNDEMVRIASSALERVPVNTDTFAFPVAVLTPKVLATLANDFGVRELDLIRALIETHRVVLDRKNYIVSIDVKAGGYES